MNKDIQIKEETKELKDHIRMFHCDACDIRFSNRDTLNAHRQHYCTEQEAAQSHSTDSEGITRVKRKSTDTLQSSSISKKRLSLLSNHSDCDISLSQVDKLLEHRLQSCRSNSPGKKKTFSFNRPIQIGKFIYVPIPIIPSNHDNTPLDLSQPKKNNSTTCERTNPAFASTAKKEKESIPEQRFYQCNYCSIDFRSLKTLHAHQDNYCLEYRKQKTKSNNDPSVDEHRSSEKSLSVDLSRLFVCSLCEYCGTTLREMRLHMKYHLANNKPCPDDDIRRKSKVFSILPARKGQQFLLQCTICSAMFDSEDTLFNHMKCVHINRRFLQCLECQSRFCSKWNLIRHMKFAHTHVKSNPLNLTPAITNKSTKRRFSCSFCHVNYQNIDTLKEHMTNYCSSRSTRSGSATDTYCSSCEISFLKKTSYEAHKRFYCPDARKTQTELAD